MQSIASLSVLELAGCASAALCTKLFAGFGARVLRIPAPASAETFPLSAEEHAWFNTGKSDLAVDWNSEADRRAFERLLDGADLVVDGWGVDVLGSLGLDPETLAQRWPRLILCQLTPFGQTGPYRNFKAEDITLYAMSGLMNSTGDGAREPLNARPRIARVTAALNAYAACGMALLRRERDGSGDVIDVSIHESAIENIETALSDHLHLGKVARRANDNHALVPWRTYSCKDGWATIVGGPMRHWLKGAALFGEPQLLQPPLSEIGGRMEHREAFETLIRPWLAQHTREEIFHAGQKRGLAWGHIAHLSEVLDSPQMLARGFFVEHDDTELGRYRMPGAIYRGPDCVWQDRPRPAAPIPIMQASREVRASPPPAPAGRRGIRKPALAGIKVVDFSHDWAGPHCGRLLADFGAEVTKVEYVKLLDSGRGGRRDMIDEHPRVWNLHRGKRSVTLDLKDPEQFRICEALIREADVLIENSRAGVMDRKGLSREHLQRLNPRLVHVAMSGFGATGPLASYAGYGGTLESLSGLQTLTGYRDDGPRYRVRELDVLNGITPAGAVLAALWHRERTGRGQYVDFSELEGCAWYAGEHFVRASREKRDPAVLGNRHPQFAPQGCYPCAGADQWLTLCVRSDLQWQRLAALIGGGALDPAYNRNEQRRERHDELDALIAGWLQTQDATAAMHRLQELGIAAGRVLNTYDLTRDPHLGARAWFIESSEGRFPGPPFCFRDGGQTWRWRGPRLGEHNAEIFGRLAPGLALPDLSPARLVTAYDSGRDLADPGPEAELDS